MKVDQKNGQMPRGQCYWKTAVYHTGSRMMCILVWVDDNPQNNKEIVSLAESHGINVFEMKTTEEAIEFLEKYEKTLSVSPNTEVRIITDMHRIEEGIEKKKAGLELIEKIDGIESLRKMVRFVKIYSSSESIEEAKVYALFYPEHLTINKWLFESRGKKLFENDDILYVDYDMSVDDPIKALNLTTKSDPYCRMFNERYVNHILNTLKNDLQDKLKTSQKLRYEIKNIRYVLNQELLKRHRDLYFKFEEELGNVSLTTTSTTSSSSSTSTTFSSSSTSTTFSSSSTSTAFSSFSTSIVCDMSSENITANVKTIDHTMPKSLLVYHGTKEHNINSILKNGLTKSGSKDNGIDDGYYGDGYYLTTYPQYAAHYIRFRGVDRSDGFKSPVELGGECKIIAGFCLPGKSFKINAIQIGKTVMRQEGFDSHVVRVHHAKGDFYPVPNMKNQNADELVIFKTEQFLPCFVVTLKRVSPNVCSNLNP